MSEITENSSNILGLGGENTEIENTEENARSSDNMTGQNYADETVAESDSDNILVNAEVQCETLTKIDTNCVKDVQISATHETPNTSNSQEEAAESNLILSEYKAATLKLLEEVSSEVTTVPESDVSEEANITPPPTMTLERTIDLTKPDSVEIVTLTSESSSENSRSSNVDDVEIAVDLTNESNNSNSGIIIDVCKEQLLEQSALVEPTPKRQKLETEPIQVDLTEDSNMSVEMDVVVVQEVKDETTSAEINMEILQSQSVFEFKCPTRQLTGAWECFKDSESKNYLRGCKWAPDGTCILTNSNDNKLKIFNLPDELYYAGGENKIIPEMTPVLSMKEANTVYDFCWYPLMSSSQPETACLAVTSKGTPIHLYDAFTGDLRCSYRAYNHVDEVVAAHCVEFSLDGNKLYCGFNKMIRVFDVTRPGRDFENRPTFAKDGQRGIISCIDNSPTEDGLYAAGSYSRSIALYSEPAGAMVCMFEGQHGGVTQIKFSPDGTRLYSGGRKDNEILCWDMRNPGQILFSLLRTVVTNQRIYFDITSDSKYLVSGSHDGTVLVWDTTTAPVQLSVHSDPIIQPAMAFEGHSDTVNGISLHPSLPLIASASGQRHFRSFDSDDDVVEIDESKPVKIDNSLRLWWT